MRHPAPLPKAGPIEVTIHVIDMTVKALLLQRKELAAQLPKRQHRPKRAYLWDPSTHDRIHFEKEEETL
jgi:hypothetical protein